MSNELQNQKFELSTEEMKNWNYVDTWCCTFSVV